MTNKAQLIRIIDRYGPITPVQLAVVLHHPASCAITVPKSLIDEGYIEVVGVPRDPTPKHPATTRIAYRYRYRGLPERFTMDTLPKCCRCGGHPVWTEAAPGWTMLACSGCPQTSCAGSTDEDRDDIIDWWGVMNWRAD